MSKGYFLMLGNEAEETWWVIGPGERQSFSSVSEAIAYEKEKNE